MHIVHLAGTPVRDAPPRAAAALLCVLALLLWTPLAFGHASLVGSDPAAGGTLSAAPAQVRLRFNEPVSPLVLKIIQPDGSALDIDPQHVRTLSDGLQISLPGLPQQGAYALSWRVVSADGHPVGGSVTFSIGASAAGPASAESVDYARDGMIWLLRLFWYMGLFFGIGLAAVQSIHTSAGDMRRPGRRMLVLGGGATLLSLGMLGVDALDTPLSGLLAIDNWRTAASTSFGLAAALSLAALGCAAMAWQVRTDIFKKLSACLALFLLGAALACSGHASTAVPSWLARPAVWLHAIAIVLWIGWLLPLAQALGQPSGPILLKRFSRAIPTVVALLLASGALLTYLQLDRPASLWQTAYGQVLMIKLGCVSLLLGLGAYNRYRLTAAALNGDAIATRSMRPIIYAECMLAAAVLAIVALWRFTPPPRASAAAAPPSSIVAHIHTDAASAELDVQPDREGQATLTLRLRGPDGQALAAQDVDVVFSNASAGIEPIVFHAQPSPDGGWQVGHIELPYQQSWDVRIEALISDFERITLTTRLQPPD
jgi:copper transport protein